MKTKFSGILTLLLAFVVVQMTFAQERTVSGTVSDNNSLPLPGATVVIQGTSTGTSTDFDGNYTINASVGDVLNFSYVGYATQRIKVEASGGISVILQPDNLLEEVVVTGFGIKREKREITYQTETVDEQLLNQAQSTRAASSLAGKVAGLQINVQNNGVNPSSQILLRGLRSIGQSNQALVVIDGAIASLGAFDDLNPQDIEDINILKGATAAAIYGSRASNGALIVTTKQGKLGESITIGLNTTLTVEDVAYMPDFQSEYGTGWQGAYDPIENTNWGPRFDGTIRQVGPTFADGTFQTLPYAPVKDNALDFFETGFTTQNTLYLSGGNESGRLYLSIGNQDTKGITPNDTYERTTIRANASKKMGKLEIAVNSTFFRDEVNEVGNTLGSQNRTLYWFVLNQPANIPINRYQDWQNDLYSSPNGYFNGYYQNPYYMVDTSRDTDQTNRLAGNLSASYDAFDWLNLTARLGGNIFNAYGKEWRDAFAYTTAYTRPSDITSFVQDSESQFIQYTVDFLATLDFTIKEDFTLKTILGATNFYTKNRGGSTRGNNLSIPGLYDISNATGNLIGTAFENQRRTYGIFGDITVGYKNWLFLNFSGRQDYTSTLPTADNSYFYPAFGASLVLTDAIPELKSDVLNYLKITGSNSTVYNDLGAEQIIESYNQTANFPFGNINAFSPPGGFIDAGIKKEKIETTEFGINLGLLKNRVTIDASYFKTITTDNIVNTTTPFSSAGTGLLTNIGELEGDGIEVTLGATILRSDDFSWDVNVNYFTNQTTVNKIGGGLTEITLASSGEFGVFAVEGEQFPLIKASAYYRDPSGNIVVNPNTGNPISTTERDGTLKELGTTVPDYVIGLSSSVNYKDFRLAATFDYRTGHVYYAQGSDAMEFTGRSQTNDVVRNRCT